MQMYHPDAANSFYSLDDRYRFYADPPIQEVINEHKAQNQGEINLNLGDLVDAVQYHRNGYLKGTNRRTGKAGFYPSYKVKEFIPIVSFPKYDKVPLKISAGGGNGMGNQSKQ